MNEYDVRFYGDGIVTGRGKINDRTVFAFS